ncbi:MAG: NADH-quinone oxidoreductase subunit C [Cenarchaeum sp. SB0665_bin_23]|nr:NADH-quinone oxidoreductase subunit C [Cenarchaeum sp. SB0667_bin_13]MXY37923.1 NADH-quinone oxidoreductase subunit C [Cenarchaeum sp. SB0664_bin_35]MXY60798.1 NADH-quinone oxidoreductase subunit C [Cenarchaeum sp. SB0665_bin_23]MXZ92971.1 NADH-quinone oxidoreductase subunit C [Cenarchaeum sp. SB0666_bin_15]MYB47246.1 NADH-quinone oxidoreductase subunit C [Cenarchaeum sp. SB0662_bin_33]MYC80229.1 NADH-quinone oxidoreductase subunit C [Cenarchaeum sp. SB0661_bin_35]MYD58172.1 NADH-quinone o
MDPLIPTTQPFLEKFPDVTIISDDADRPAILVPKEQILDAAIFAKEMGFDHAESVSGVDYPDENEIEVVYHLGSYTNDAMAKCVLALATRAPREDAPRPGQDSTRLPTLREVFYSVEFHEREIFEMLGVYFEGHPDNRRLLLPEDWADLPPMRKDFAIKGR